jgi:hypothetical protein
MALQKEKVQDLYRPFSTVTIVNSEKFQWSGYVSRMLEIRNAHEILVGKDLEDGGGGKITRNLYSVNLIFAMGGGVGATGINQPPTMRG